MKNITNTLSLHWIKSRSAWRCLTMFVEALNRRNELEELVTWARRRRLTGVHNHYQRLLDDVEGKLLLYQVRSRRIFVLAQWLCEFKRQLQPLPPYYPKGYASKYSKSHQVLGKMAKVNMLGNRT